MDWSQCELVEVVPGKVSGAPVFKGTRLPVSTIVENVECYVEDGLTVDQAVRETLESFPTVPGGMDGILAVLAFQAAHEPQPAC